METDVNIEDDGNMIVFWLNSNAAFEWVQSHVTGDHQMFGRALLAVAPRYAQTLTAGMAADGLSIE